MVIGNYMRSVSLLFICFTLNSCVQSFIVPKKIKQKITFCYDGKPTGLDTLIKINGFYQTMDIWWNDAGYGKSFDPKKDTNYINFIFSNDGICGYHFWGTADTAKKNLEARAKNLKNNDFPGLYKGVYKVFSDTIKIQVINDCRWAMPTWMGKEIWYKIIDLHTLKLIGYKNLNNNKLLHPEKKESPKLAYFIPVDTIPSSDIWLKKKKWFWCDRKQYEKWKSLSK